MKVTLLLMLSVAAAPAPGMPSTATADASRVEPLATRWNQLEAAGFDPTWVLPRGGLQAVGSTGDLVAQMERLLARPGVVALIQGWREARKDAGQQDRFATARADAIRALSLGAEEAEALRALLNDDGMRAPGWRPDEEGKDDGFHFGAPVDRRRLRQPAWHAPKGSSVLQQGATLFLADVQAIKDVENDYGAYMRHVGNSYEAIHPKHGSHRVGSDADGRRYSSVEVYWRCDLPFPFDDYQCDLWVLNRLDESHRLIADVYSTSRDFYWLAGRDTFLPVKTSEGEWLATLVVRSFGFDLRGVPDRDAERRTGIRGGLGNLKLRAEVAFAAAGSKCRDVAGRLPRLLVQGASGSPAPPER